MNAKNIYRFPEHTGDSYPSYLTVAKWLSEFQFVWESLEDYLYSGWPRSATILEMIAKCMISS